MADIIDLANDLIDHEVSRALGKIRESSPQDQISIKICEDCGDDIPEPRQALKLKRCKSCAEDFERRKALYASSGTL